MRENMIARPQTAKTGVSAGYAAESETAPAAAVAECHDVRG